MWASTLLRSSIGARLSRGTVQAPAIQRGAMLYSRANVRLAPRGVRGLVRWRALCTTSAASDEERDKGGLYPYDIKALLGEFTPFPDIFDCAQVEFVADDESDGEEVPGEESLWRPGERDEYLRLLKTDVAAAEKFIEERNRRLHTPISEGMGGPDLGQRVNSKYTHTLWPFEEALCRENVMEAAASLEILVERYPLLKECVAVLTAGQSLKAAVQESASTLKLRSLLDRAHELTEQQMMEVDALSGPWVLSSTERGPGYPGFQAMDSTPGAEVEMLRTTDLFEQYKLHFEERQFPKDSLIDAVTMVDRQREMLATEWDMADVARRGYLMPLGENVRDMIMRLPEALDEAGGLRCDDAFLRDAVHYVSMGDEYLSDEDESDLVTYCQTPIMRHPLTALETLSVHSTSVSRAKLQEKLTEILDRLAFQPPLSPLAVPIVLGAALNDPAHVYATIALVLRRLNELSCEWLGRDELQSLVALVEEYEEVTRLAIKYVHLTSKRHQAHLNALLEAADEPHLGIQSVDTFKMMKRDDEIPTLGPTFKAIRDTMRDEAEEGDDDIPFTYSGIELPRPEPDKYFLNINEAADVDPDAVVKLLSAPRPKRVELTDRGLVFPFEVLRQFIQEHLKYRLEPIVPVDDMGNLLEPGTEAPLELHHFRDPKAFPHGVAVVQLEAMEDNLVPWSVNMPATNKAFCVIHWEERWILVSYISSTEALQEPLAENYYRIPPKWLMKLRRCKWPAADHSLWPTYHARTPEDMFAEEYPHAYDENVGLQWRR